MPHGSLKILKAGSPSPKVKVAVVGIGHLGKFHAEKYASIPEAEIVGLVDIDRARAEEWAGKLGTEAFSDYRSLLGRVDAVSVVVPTDRHHRVAVDFLKSGSDVLLEKPICSTLLEAEDLIGIARDCGRILQVGHLERFNPAILAARGKIKAPLFIESHRLTPFRGRGIEVDVVLDLMIHDLDIILSFVRSEVAHIHAVGVPVLTEKVDIANARLEFASGCVANITASRISGEDQRRIRIFQPDTYLTVDYASQKVGLSQRTNSGRGIPQAKISAEQIPVEPGDALEKEIRSFIFSSMNRTPPLVTGEDGKKALVLALRIIEQIQTNIKKIPSIASFYGMKEILPDVSW